MTILQQVEVVVIVMPYFRSIAIYAYCVWLLHKYEAHIKGLPICFSEVQVKNDVTDNNNKHDVTAFEGECRNIIELREHLKLCFLVMLFVCFGSVPAFVPRGQLPREDLRRSSPTTQATRHPRASLFFMFPIPPYLLSCILHQVSPLPCPPVLYRYPTKYLVCPLPVFLSYTCK